MANFVKVENDYEYLVESDLLKKEGVLKLCYVLDYGWGKSKFGEGFYSLIIKTADGITLNAMIFNPKFFISAGLEFGSLKGKFILLKGTPQIFRDRYSIIVEEIQQIDQSKVSNRELFIGKIGEVDLLFGDCEMVFELVGKLIPYGYKVESYPSIYSGRVGGYTKFMRDWVFQTFVYGEAIGDEILIPLYYCVVIYEKYLSKLKSAGCVSKSDSLKLLRELPNTGSAIDDLTADAVSSVLGLGIPEHLYANIIFNTFRNAVTINSMYGDWSSLVKGGELRSKDYTLKKY